MAQRLKAEDVRVGVVYAAPTNCGSPEYRRRFDRKVVSVTTDPHANTETVVGFVRRGPGPKRFAGVVSTCKLSSFVRSAGRAVAE